MASDKGGKSGTFGAIEVKINECLRRKVWVIRDHGF